MAGSAPSGAGGHALEGAREAALPAQRPTLLATKLALPPARGTHVTRPRLTQRLDQGVRGPLTVISASPGFGKTTLLQAWRQTASGAAWPLAWLALDTADNAPARFLAYLIAALQTGQDGLGDAALVSSRPLTRPPAWRS
jgi:LuxR family transcriptional regulator, maltose regulon positive regulatory protein